MKTMKSKIASVISSVFLIGSSILSAHATGYPEPFITQGQFSGNLVVGANAQSSDILGSVDIMTSLQYSSKTPASMPTSTNDVFIDSGYKVQKSGDYFNYGDDIADVMQNGTLSEDELPRVLSDGKFVESEGDNKNSISYTQELRFYNDNAVLEYTQDDDLAPNAGDYLVIKESELLYNYNLEFDSSVEYDNTNSATATDDLKTALLTIQNKPYTITDVTLDQNNGEIEKISLLSGESVMWQTQNQPIIKTIDGVQHTIEVLDVTESADACQVKVDGYSTIIDEGESRTINGIQMGVVDVRAIHAQLQDVDICQLSFGSSEIELQNGQEIIIDGNEVDGTNVIFDQSPGELNAINIDYSSSDIGDDVYLSKDDSFVDPLFNSWKILYGGIGTDYSTYNFKVSGDHKGEFKFTTNDRRSITLPIFSEGNNTFIGESEDADDKYYANAIYVGASLLDNSCQNINECEGMKILATPTNGELHVFELSNIDTNDNTLDVKDVTYGRNYDSIDYIQNVNTQIDLGSFGNFNVLVNETGDNVVVYNTMKSKIELNNEELLEISENPLMFTLTEDNDVGNNVLKINVFQNNDDEMQVTADWTNPSVNSVEANDNSDDSIMVSVGGTKVIIDDEKSKVVIQSPNDDDEVYGNVFISEIGSKLIDIDYGMSYNLNRIEVNTARLDSEMGDISNVNLISVGGPCINTITKRILGITSDGCGTNSGLTQGHAMIKSIAQANGKVSIVVSGWESEDTRRASRVLADYTNYNLNLTPGSSYDIISNLGNIVVTKSS